MRKRHFAQLVLVLALISSSLGCQFYPPGEYLRFVRVSESLPVGGEVLVVQVYPRRNLSVQPEDKPQDAHYFTYKEVNETAVKVILAQTLEDLVDNDAPQNVLKFRLACDNGNESISSFLSVTVYVEDVNDHAPQFIDVPYHVTVDELTPTGLTIFRGIHAFDQDKPNTPNSEVQYSIVGGNEAGKFALESSHRAALVVKEPLDYDSGDVEFQLSIMASDRGTPPRNSTTTMTVIVQDNDDLSPRFTRDLYRVQVQEFYPVLGEPIHKELDIKPHIKAIDQDIAINASVTYDIVAGNDKQYFELDSNNGSLFLNKEVDRERLSSNFFTLQIQASQNDNPLKTGVARVEVEVLDINDNLPQFEVELYNISIVENLPSGFSVLQVIATDKDQGDNGEFVYQLDDPSRAFSIDSRSGWLTVRDQSQLDRERQESLSMKVFAREKVPNVAAGGSSSFVSVEITLLDANDNNPTFVPSNLYEFQVLADSTVGDVVGQVVAVDPDLGRNGKVFYDFQKTNTSNANPFTIEAKTGHILVLDSPLKKERYTLFVEASDQPANPSERRFSLAVVQIDVLRGGDPVPDFIGAPYEFWVGANVGVSTSVGQIRVKDMDKKHVVYDLLHSYRHGVPFAVEERSGTITVVDELSRYNLPIYDFEAFVTDGRTTLITNVTIHIVDPEDRSSSGQHDPVEFRVRENMPGALVGQLRLAEAMRWKSGTLQFLIVNQDAVDKFAVSEDGTIYTQRGLDREEREVYQLTIITESRGIIKGEGVYQVTIRVEDENDNPPLFEFSSYEGRVRENSPPGTPVVLDHLIKATDADSGNHAIFLFTLFGEGSELFHIDQHTGKLFIKERGIDREEKAIYNLKIVARDKGNLSSEAKLVVHVDDVNDNPPKFLQMVVLETRDGEDDDTTHTALRGDIVYTMDPGNMTVNEVVTLEETTAVGTSVIRLLAGDRDANDNSALLYKINTEQYYVATNGTSTFKPKRHISPRRDRYFSIHPMNGEVAVAKPLPPQMEFLLNVTAMDPGGLKSNMSLRIRVKDINNHPPVFKRQWYNFDLPEGVYEMYHVGRVEAVDKDFGENAKVSYSIETDNVDIPFIISKTQGILTVSGVIDRETKSLYAFKVIAEDEGDPQLHSSVDVEVQIRDVNDNPPTFYGFERIIEVSHARNRSRDAYTEVSFMPVYYATIPENAYPGDFVAQVYANDTDDSGNGNGVLLFSLSPQQKNFFIDSKHGVIKTLGRLDYETRSVHNLTVLASDLGNPSLSASALVMVTLTDVHDDDDGSAGRVFPEPYYEVAVEENVDVPMPLLTLNLSDTYRGLSMDFNIIETDGPEMFQVDPRRGTLYLVKSPDRENQNEYTVKVRANRSKRGRSIPVIMYPISMDRMNDLDVNEVKVVIKVKDMNDNVPRFTINGRPIIAAIPTTANYGYEIVRLQAKDPDEGINGEVRYDILSKLDDESHKFDINPVTGQVRSIVSFARDGGKVYGFDVKATDRRGAENGRSAIANVFVYVLDEQKQLVMVIGARPTIVEANMENITQTLYNVTGLDVRVRKLEPHVEGDIADIRTTDLYLYAVDPQMNVLIDMDTLQQVFSTREGEIKKYLDNYKVMDIRSAPLQKSRQYLHAIEVGVVVLGCIVFIGALAAAICVGCIKRKRRLNSKVFPPPPLGFSLDFRLPGKNLYPASSFSSSPYLEASDDTTDTYMEMHSQSSSSNRPSPNSCQHSESCRNHQRHHHHRNGKVVRKSSSLNGQRDAGGPIAPLVSLQSSRDSGFKESHQETRCGCGHSSHSSISSNASYEDSLKSLRQQPNGEETPSKHRRRQRQPSSHENHQPSPVHQAPPMQRRPSERILMCSLTNKAS